MLNIGETVSAKSAEEYFEEDIANQKLYAKLIQEKAATKNQTNEAVEKTADDNLIKTVAATADAFDEDGFIFGQPRTKWHGRLSEDFGLSGAVTKEEFKFLCRGKHPLTGEQLIRNVKPRSLTKPNGKTYQTKSHRAGLDQSISAPKPISLLAMQDERVIGTHWQSALKAIDAIEEFTSVKMGNSKSPEPTGKALYGTFLHFEARPDKEFGYAALDLHNHFFEFNLAPDKKGQFRALETREIYRCQKLATAVYRSELIKEMTALGYEMKVNKKTGAPEVVGISREYVEAASPRQREIIEKAKELGIKSTKIVAGNYRQSKNFDREEMVCRHNELEERFGFQATKAAEKAKEKTKQVELEEQNLTLQEREFLKQIKAEKAAEKVKESFDFAVANSSERKTSDKPKRRMITRQSLMADALNFAIAEITFDDVKAELVEREKNGELKEFDLDRQRKSKQGNPAVVKSVDQSEILKTGEENQSDLEREVNSEAEKPIDKIALNETSIDADHSIASENKTFNQPAKTDDKRTKAINESRTDAENEDEIELGISNGFDDFGQYRFDDQSISPSFASIESEQSAHSGEATADRAIEIKRGNHIRDDFDNEIFGGRQSSDNSTSIESPADESAKSDGNSLPARDDFDRVKYDESNLVIANRLQPETGGRADSIENIKSTGELAVAIPTIAANIEPAEFERNEQQLRARNIELDNSIVEEGNVGRTQSVQAQRGIVKGGIAENPERSEIGSSPLQSGKSGIETGSQAVAERYQGELRGLERNYSGETEAAGAIQQPAQTETVGIEFGFTTETNFAQRDYQSELDRRRRSLEQQEQLDKQFAEFLKESQLRLGDPQLLPEFNSGQTSSENRLPGELLPNSIPIFGGVNSSSGVGEFGKPNLGTDPSAIAGSGMDDKRLCGSSDSGLDTSVSKNNFNDRGISISNSFSDPDLFRGDSHNLQQSAGSDSRQVTNYSSTLREKLEQVGSTIEEIKTLADELQTGQERKASEEAAKQKMIDAERQEIDEELVMGRGRAM